MRPRATFASAAIITALLTASCTPLGSRGGGSGATTGTPGGQAPSTSTVTVPGSQGTTAGETPFRAPAAKVSAYVVNVGIGQRIQGMPTSTEVGNGSGIIIRADGYILTNNHVVEGSDAITAVIGSDTVAAKVVGRDPSTDLAVIKVERTGLPAAPIGTPSDLQVGDWVVAVGYPFGVGKTVTHGIVSALGRSALSPVSQRPGATSSVAAYTDLIQTDAPINPGNSGGALAALDGTVVGVNTLIESPSGTSAGIGFAIPIDFAMKVAQQLISTGRAVHPFLGIGIVSVTPHVADQLNLEATQGVLVQQVQSGRAAAQAGMREGDVIVEMAGQPITDVEDLYAVLRQQRIGATVPVVVQRGRQQQTLNVTIGSDKAQ